MSYGTLTPASTTSKVALTSTGSAAAVDAAVPYKIYSSETSNLYDKNFLSGAVDQVAYVYKKLGGDVLDIEITPGNVYTAYEEAVLEYSYIVNVHQANNLLSNALGSTTGSFDDKGVLSGSTLSSGANIALKFPKFDFGFERRVSEGFGAEAGLRNSIEYSASFNVTTNQQDYDLQSIVSSSAAAGGVPYASVVGNKKILVKKVFYKTPHAMWRFYGYYGGLNVVGNLHNYGQYSDDSTFQLVPTWQNKAQALAFEDAIYTRMSHFSYEIKDNKLRIFPVPQSFSPSKMWIQFSVNEDPWTEGAYDDGVAGVNNMNTLPIENIPFKNINAIGKQWIRRFALALCKEMLGQVRSKFATVPIPGESVTLNGSDLISQAKEEQNALREELKTTLAEMTYDRLVAKDAELAASVENVMKDVPVEIFVG
tara:strand:+ start:3262 stop:4533 length:1272 start_codon:yes stop_codon:yes gene_type:complete